VKPYLISGFILTGLLLVGCSTPVTQLLDKPAIVVEKDGISATLPKGWQPFMPYGDFGGLAFSSHALGPGKSALELIIERSPSIAIRRELKAFLPEKGPSPWKDNSIDTFASLKGKGRSATNSASGTGAPIAFTVFFPKKLNPSDSYSTAILKIVNAEPDRTQLAELAQIAASIEIKPLPMLSEDESKAIIAAATKAHPEYEFDSIFRDGPSLVRVYLYSETHPTQVLLLTFKPKNGRWAEDSVEIQKAPKAGDTIGP